MAFSLYATILLVHIVGAVLWLGAGAFWLTIMRPAVLDAGPAGGAVMKSVLTRGGLGKWFGPVALVTILAGLFLYIDGDHMQNPFATTSTSMLTIGVATGIAAFVMAFGFSMPLEKKMKALVGTFPKDGPPAPEQMGQMQGMADKAAMIAKATVATLAVTVVFMAGRGIVA